MLGFFVGYCSWVVFGCFWLVWEKSVSLKDGKIREGWK